MAMPAIDARMFDESLHEQSDGGVDIVNVWPSGERYGCQRARTASRRKLRDGVH